MITDVQPLRAVRFDAAVSGPIGPLLAPPYDVASAPVASAEYSIAGIENVDLGVAGDQHALAAARYQEWLRRGILRRDPEPAIYFHEHTFASLHGNATRQALIARVRLADWGEGAVLPHERTMLGPRQERGGRLRATAANLSPLYFLVRDPEGDLRQIIAAELARSEPSVEHDQIGGTHRLAPVTDAEVHARIHELLQPRALFVADGHHRYEAALAYRDEQRRAPGWRPDAPAEFVLVMLAAVEDPGVIVRPTHRLLVGSGRQQLLREVLQRWFVLEPVSADKPSGADHAVVARVVLGPELGPWDIRAREDRSHTALLPAGRGPAWRSLPVAAVEAVLESAIGVGDEAQGARIRYTIDERDAIERVARGEAEAAFLLPPPRLDRILAVAEEGDLLPAKSTWFEPKAPAGLVINDLREEFFGE